MAIEWADGAGEGTRTLDIQLGRKRSLIEFKTAADGDSITIFEVLSAHSTGAGVS
jgi:hypothetical protein